MGNSSSGGDSGSWTNWCYIYNDTPYHVTIEDYDNTRPLQPYHTQYNYLLKGATYYINLVINLPGSGKETRRLYNYEYQGKTHKISEIFNIDIKRYEDQKREQEQERKRKLEEERRRKLEARKREEEERRRKEEALRKQREEQERRQREEAERRRKEEEARKQREEQERRQREEAERRRKQEEARKQREEQERRQREEAERRRKQEEARKQREEQERRQREEAERKRKEEEARKQREEEERKQRERERQAKIKQKQDFNEKLSKKTKLAKKFVSWNGKSKERQKEAQIKSHKPHHPLCHLSLLHQAQDTSETIQHVPVVATESRKYTCSFQKQFLYKVEEYKDHKTSIYDATFTKKIVFMIFNIAPSDDLNPTWLKQARIYLLSQYVRINGVSLTEEEHLFQFLTSIENSLNDKESLSLTKTMGKALYDSMSLKSECTPMECTPMEYLCVLLKYGSQLYRVHTKWMKQCFNIWVLNVIPSSHKQLQSMLVDEAPLTWSPYDKLCFMQQCSVSKFSVDQKKHLLHLVQSYSLLYSVVETAMKNQTFEAIVSKLEEDINSETQKSLEKVMSEIEDTKLLDRKTLGDVRDIMNKVYHKILNNKFDLKVDHNQYFNDNILVLQTKFALSTTPDNDMLSTIVATVACAVKKTHPYFPYVTSLVSLTVLLVSDKMSVNRLLEVMTGEGKSTIIAMFAAVLGMKGRQVDIVTSSPILASRDAEEWQEFYNLFGLSCTHNHLDTEIDADQQRIEIYKKNIVYGTVSAFAADILREKFEQDHVRSGRRYDVIIADEVDLLMLDQGVQFTYLSHNATVLHHMEPILASVWSIIGQFKPVLTMSENVLYVGKPALITNTIAESIGLKSPINIFIFAEQNGFLHKNKLKDAMRDDLSSQQEALAIGFKKTERAIEFLAKFPFSFDAYTVTENGQIELTKHTTGTNEGKKDSENYQPTHASNPAEGKKATDEEEKPVKILVLNKGIACLLYTREELEKCATSSVQDHMDFSETLEDPGDHIRARDMKVEDTKLKIPSFLKEYVLNQLPQYIESAIRCLFMVEDREYTIQLDGDGRNGKVIPVDFQNSGVIELNKRWGGGLQQMLEMKHNLSMSSMSLVTNFMSHVGFFLCYKAIYGMSGTLGFEPSTHLTNEDDPDFENAFPDVLNDFFGSDSESDTIVSDDVFIEKTVHKAKLEATPHATPLIPPTSYQLHQTLTPYYNGDYSPLSTATDLDLSNITTESELESTVDSPAISNTQSVLLNVFQVHVCNIPTHMCRKLYEKPAILVKMGETKWFHEITESIREAITNEHWKPGTGRAVLVLCEDIKTATQLRDFFYSNVEWLKDKITLYAHSGSSKELKALKHKFSSGEVVIATNLAGRGTNIKITKDVNESGGLFCIVTFLPRNRRVELQAFGRTARKGEPGSVQCILDMSSLPPQYNDHDLGSIRELRSKQEKLRLDELIEFDVKEVKLKEKLFQKHCAFISEIHEQIGPRNDKRVILNSLNENWGRWLEMRSDRIEQLDEVKLIPELRAAHDSWCPKIPPVATDVIHLPITNFYYFIKFGNQLLMTNDKDSLEKACQYYNMSIDKEPTYSAFAYYNRAYCTICLRKSGYMDKAIEDLKNAKKRLLTYTNDALVVMNCVNIVLQIHQRTSTLDDMNLSDLHELKAQMETRLQVFDFVEKKIQDTITKLESFQKSDDDATADPVSIFDLIPDSDDLTEEELYTLWNLGMEVTFTVKKKPKFRFDALAVFLLGAVEFVGGALLIAFTAGAAAEFGMTLLGEGISDMFDGAIGMATGEFSLKDWAIYKAIGLAASLASGGISRLAGLESKAIKFSKVIKELEESKDIFRNATKYGEAAKESAQTAMKYAGKQVLEQGTMRLAAYVGNKAFDKIVEKIAEGCMKDLQPALNETFTKGELGKIVNKHFMSQLSEEYISDDEIPPVVERNAQEFVSELGSAVIVDLVKQPDIQPYLKAAGQSLFAELSQKDIRFTSGELIIGEMSIVKAKEDLKHFTAAFIPHMEEKSKTFITEYERPMSDHHQLQENPKASQLSCGRHLKEDLASLMGEAYKEAVIEIVHNNLDVVVNHGLNRTVGHMARKIVGKHVLHTDKTYQHLLAGQHANYIRYAGISQPEHSERSQSSHTEHSEGSHSEHSTKHRKESVQESEDDEKVKKIAEEIRKPTTPGSVLELRILAEQHGKSVSVYQEKNGKPKPDYTINKGAADKKIIELVHIPPCDRYPNGHYKLKGDESDIQGSASKDSNCLYRAFAKGMHPHLSQDELAKTALTMRKKTADEITKNRHLTDHVIRRLELQNLEEGDYYARLGAGRNATTKVLKGCFKEKKRGKKLSVIYVQKNNVLCKAERVYSKRITVEEKEQWVVHDDSRLESLVVYMKGLNFPNNIGRCWTTKPLTGTVKFTLNGENISKFFPMISYHVNPSEAGANASNETANAMITSKQYNIIERYIWKTKVNGTTMREWIGRKNFESTANVKMGPLLPEDFDTSWFQELNENRIKQNRKPISESKKDDLRAFLHHMQSLEPRLYRVEGYTYTIWNFKREVRTLIMPRDYDFLVPESEQHIPKKDELDTIEIESIIEGHPFDKPPQYQDTSDLNPNSTQKKMFTDASSLSIPMTKKRPVINVLQCYNDSKSS